MTAHGFLYLAAIFFFVFASFGLGPTLPVSRLGLIGVLCFMFAATVQNLSLHKEQQADESSDSEISD